MLKTIQNNTAILIFAQSASQELEQKSFTQNTNLFEALNKETLLKVKKTGLPYFHSTEKQQSGTSFGERFVNAIQDLYNKGFENVITIGNDSPQLRTEHLLTAYQQLQQGKTVLGPTFDGGFYLMGLNKVHFNAKLFKRLPWQRFSLFNRISRLFHQKNLHLFKLPVLQDIDTEKDISVLLRFAKTISVTVKKLLLALKSAIDHFFKRVNTNYSYTHTSVVFNKGSPFLLHLS